jgi:hypothetical protein
MKNDIPKYSIFFMYILECCQIVKNMDLESFCEHLLLCLSCESDFLASPFISFYFSFPPLLTSDL